MSSTRRPLNALERFFCAEPSRNVGEAKVVGIAGVITINTSLIGWSHDRVAADGGRSSFLSRIESAATAAWCQAAHYFPYLRSRIEFEEAADAGGEVPTPFLAVDDEDAFVLRCRMSSRSHSDTPSGTVEQIQMVRVLQADSCVGLSVDAALDECRKQPFDERNTVATVVLGVRSFETGESVMIITLSHVGTDARGAFSVARVFLKSLEYFIGTSSHQDGGEEVNATRWNFLGDVPLSLLSSTPMEDPPKVHDLLQEVGIERIVSNPLRPPLVPDGMPPLVAPAAPDQIPWQDALGRITVQNVNRVMSEQGSRNLLQVAKKLNLSIQSIFSAVGSVVMLSRDPVLVSSILRSDASSSSPSTTGDDDTTSSSSVITLGTQVTVQMRDLIEPPLPKCSVILGGSVFWVYVPVSRNATLLSIAQLLHAQIRNGLSDGRVFGYFKMYLAPPPWAGAGGSSNERLKSISTQQAKHFATFNFTNVGLTECSTCFSTPTDDDRTGTAASGDSESNAAKGAALQVSRLTMEIRLSGGGTVQPPMAYMRAHAHTFNGMIHFAVSYTDPCYSRAFVEAFAEQIVHWAESFVELLPVSEEGHVHCSSIVLEPLHSLLH